MENKRESDLKIWGRTTVKIVIITFLIYYGLLFYTSVQDTTFSLNNPLQISGDRYFTNIERPIILEISTVLGWANPLIDESKIWQNLVKVDETSVSTGVVFSDTITTTVTKCKDRTDIDTSVCE